MEATPYLQTAALLLGIAALGGISLAVMRFRSGANPPSWIAMAHGLLAAAALTLLLYAGFTAVMPPAAWIGTLVLLVAALLGATMKLVYHERLRPLPKWLVLLHGLFALAGFGFVLLSLR